MIKNEKTYKETDLFELKMASKTGMFDGFDQLDVRIEKLQEKTALDTILDLEAKIISTYASSENAINVMYGCFNHDKKLYDSISKEVNYALLKKDVFKKTLQMYISSRDNKDETKEALVRGMYSAALLEIVCTREPHSYITLDCQSGNLFCQSIDYVATSDITVWNIFDSHISKITHLLKQPDLTSKQKSIFLEIETIVENIHTLPFEQQKEAHDKIARLQEEIFIEVEK